MSKEHVIDYHKAKCIAGICEVLQGMEADYVEDILLAMVRERDTILAALHRKQEIVNQVRWGYGGG